MGKVKLAQKCACKNFTKKYKKYCSGNKCLILYL